MPHFIIEYTDNLRAEGDIPGLLKKANAVIMAQGGVFPTGAIRSRAVALTDWFIADGSHDDDAFVHATLKIGAGRSPAIRKKTCDDLFAMMVDHFAALYARRGLALSMELYEFDEAGTYKHNNIHARYRKP